MLMLERQQTQRPRGRAITEVIVRMVGDGDVDRKPGQERTVPTRGTPMVVGHVRRGAKQPRQHRSVDESDSVTTSPGFQECRGDHVVGISGYQDEPVRVPADAAPMAIEDQTERLAVAGTRPAPVVFVVHSTHTMNCPATPRTFPATELCCNADVSNSLDGRSDRAENRLESSACETVGCVLVHIERASRTLRGSLVALTATLLASLAHTIGGGAPPGMVSLVLALAFSVPFSIAMVGVGVQPLRTAAAAVGAQLTLHTTFSLSAGAAPGGQPVEGALAHSGHSLAAMRGTWVELAGTGASVHTEHFGGSMPLAHIVAAVVAVAGIRLVDGAIRAIAGVWRSILSAVALLLAPSLANAPRRNACIRSTARVHPLLARLESSVVRRGPPRGIGVAIAAHAP